MTFSPKKDVKVILITQRRVGYYCLRDHIVKYFCAMPYTYIVYLNEIDINLRGYCGQCSNITLIKENSQKMSYFCHWIVYANWTWCNMPSCYMQHTIEYYLFDYQNSIQTCVKPYIKYLFSTLNGFSFYLTISYLVGLILSHCTK